jgi:CDP-4-dehydro-6-deoxyglucose reductase, E1
MRELKLQVPTYDSREVDSILEVLKSEMVVMGGVTLKFQNLWSEWSGVKYSTMVNSGSSANLLLINLLLSMRAKYKLKRGDEVIVPAVTWSTTLFPIIQLGLKPVLVDVDERTFNISIESCSKALTPATKAVFAVHLLGNPANLDELRTFCSQHNLILLEDCCEAAGATWDGEKVGTFGTGSSFSFMFAHHISTIEGGMVCCNDISDDNVIKASRAHGWIRELDESAKAEIINENNGEYDKFLFWDMGFNVRPTELAASMGIHQLSKLDNFIKIRNRNYQTYVTNLEQLSDFIQVQQTEDDAKAGVSNFAMGFYIKNNRIGIRKELFDFLNSRGIECRPMVAGNLAKHPFYDLYCEKPRVSLEISDVIHQRGLYIPNHQNLSEDDILYACDVLREFFYA